MTFLHKSNERFGKNFETLEPALITRFQQYSWPGNVRELKSAVDRMVLLFDGPILRAPWWDLPEGQPTRPAAVSPGLQGRPTLPEGSGPAATAPVEPAQFTSTLPNIKQKLAMAKKLLAESDDNYSWVAGQLGINTSTLWRWRKAGKLG
jgi:transcriptional regulator with PAS, ATPase and Fis domain